MSKDAVPSTFGGVQYIKPAVNHHRGFFVVFGVLV